MVFVVLYMKLQDRNILPGSAHAVTSIGDTEICVEGSVGSNVTTTVVPSSLTGISTVPSSLGSTVVVET